MKTLAIFLTLSVFGFVQAQSLERQVISSNGNETKTPSVQLVQTIGEPIITTEIRDSLILSQGFNQSDEIKSGRELPIYPTLHYVIYPNPVKDIVKIQLETDFNSNFDILLLDLNGRELRRSQVTLHSGEEQIIEWDLQVLPAGNYLLRIQTDSILLPIHHHEHILQRL